MLFFYYQFILFNNMSSQVGHFVTYNHTLDWFQRKGGKGVYCVTLQEAIKQGGQINLKGNQRLARHQ